MSNIKELLGDVEYEEFKREREIVLGIYEKHGADREKFQDLCFDEFDTLYYCWLEIEGKKLALERVNELGGHIIGGEIVEFLQYMLEKFIVWLKEAQ